MESSDVIDQLSEKSDLSPSSLREKNADLSSVKSESKSESKAGSCVVAADPNLHRLADAIAAKVGPQRFHVWFDNSTRLDLRNDNLEISVPNDFIGEWIGQRFTGTIQEAAVEVFGGPLRLRFQVQPELFKGKTLPGAGASGTGASGAGASGAGASGTGATPASHRRPKVVPSSISPGDPNPAARIHAPVSPQSDGSRFPQPPAPAGGAKQKLRHDLSTYVVGPSNQLAVTAAEHVAQFPGTQYNPLFIHGPCGLGKTHLIQGLCNKFISLHPSKRWTYLTGEEFTNDYVLALKHGKVDAFRRRMREVDLLVIDDVHFLAGKKATQEEFLHTFNAIEALGKQVVMASDAHPKEISEFGESLVNRFVSGMVVRIDAPNFAMRCEILRRMAQRQRLDLSEELIGWVARRVTQNVRELEGAVTRIAAHTLLTGQSPTVELAQQALGDLERQMVAPVKPENVVSAVADYFGIDARDLMSGNRHRTVSLARSVAMYLIRKTGKLSFPEIGARLGKRNHSTVISACRRIEQAIQSNELFDWTSSTGPRKEEAPELLARLEDQARAMS